MAKAYRDLYMIKLGNKYPKYKWNKNFGYGTSQHLVSLKKFGVTSYHRRSYKPVHNNIVQIRILTHNETRFLKKKNLTTGFNFGLN